MMRFALVASMIFGMFCLFQLSLDYAEGNRNSNASTSTDSTSLIASTSVVNGTADGEPVDSETETAEPAPIPEWYNKGVHYYGNKEYFYIQDGDFEERVYQIDRDSKPVHSIVVVSGPYPEDMFQTHVDEEVREGMTAYFNMLCGITKTDFLNETPKALRNYQPKMESWDEVKESSMMGEKVMTRYTKMDFDGVFVDQATSEILQDQTQKRVKLVGVFGGSLMLLLSSFFVLYKTNSATHGLYFKRIRFIGLCTFIGIVGVAAILLQTIIRL